MTHHAPFTILCDTREQAPYAFASILTDPDRRGRRHPVSVTVERTTLRTGDYSVAGLEDRVALERKSLTDLYGTVGRGRKRFVRELERLHGIGSWAGVRQVPTPGSYFAAVIIEAELSTIIAAPPERTRMSPRAVYRSICAWMIRYPGVHWLMAPGRAAAEQWAYRMLERVWRESQQETTTTTTTNRRATE